ncbi:hypothetical protein [Streptomyces cinerochromogenes]|uniref:hypothetical protein n=1 Tax=Streptomyces cinerochromogenes TaxID=66422 RepID=UPI0019B08D2D|nr:hypothetical protein [Streptomyces cinerochromogenes]GGS63861.1 hypothetical protein GCM10010206_27760 [Streptomyces cinerochromogenes]
MARLSFEKKRAEQPVEYPATVPVRVFGPGYATVGGTSVVAAAGEEIQQAVLNHLQRLAISLGAPILATVQDDQAGCVVPLEVSTDGSSRMTGEPERVPAAPAPGPAAVPPGTVQVPTGRFGPAPVMSEAAVAAAPAGPAVPVAPVQPEPLVAVQQEPLIAVPAEPLVAVLEEPAAPVTTATPTPPRGFDAVAEEVLGDGPLTETAEGAELLTEPMSRINEAVRAGRIDAAAELADRTLTEASAVLGEYHAEVLHLRELRAYIAYLADDPVRAFRLSLDLARLRRQARDGEAAYGNVQSAATAWRAVRDPEEGLRLGRDLIDLWTDLTAEPGPAADDPRPLEYARARMVRLTDRAAKAAAQA